MGEDFFLKCANAEARVAGGGWQRAKRIFAERTWNGFVFSDWVFTRDHRQRNAIRCRDGRPYLSRDCQTGNEFRKLLITVGGNRVLKALAAALRKAGRGGWHGEPVCVQDWKIGTQSARPGETARTRGFTSDLSTRFCL
jgi:hypothetical protein